MDFVRYTPDLETLIPDEPAVIERIEQVVLKMARDATQKYGKAMHGTHAKAVGLLKGYLTVLEELPEELKQGVFAKTGHQYEVVVRYSPGPPVPISDKASGQRGMSIKVLDVEGEHIPESNEKTTQDWVLAVDKAFNARDAQAFFGIFLNLLLQSHPTYRKASSLWALKLLVVSSQLWKLLGLKFLTLSFLVVHLAIP